MKKKEKCMNKQAVFGWVMYDWANSAYATIIMTTVMPIFYSEVAGKHLAPSASTAYWGYTQSISLILVVLITPVLGAIADSMHNKKVSLPFLRVLASHPPCACSRSMKGNGCGHRSRWLWEPLLFPEPTLL
jgi:MFS-type transporter involved in bile tolerance (Atg22 family)